jgi:hypothetical protein
VITELAAVENSYTSMLKSAGEESKA